MIGRDTVCAHEPGVPELEPVAVGILGDADGALRIVVAPHVDEVSIGVEDEYGDVAAVEDVDVVFRVDGYRCGFAEPDAVRDLGPAGDWFVVCDVAGRE